MASDVLDQGVRRVEAHGLGIQQAGTERRRVVELEPATGVHEVGERHGMALREAVVGEGGQLLPDLLGDVGWDPALPRPVQEPLVEGLHAGVAALGAHGLAEPVGLSGGEPGDVDGEAHELFLEQRDAEGSCQGVLARRVEVGDLLLPVTTPDVGVDRSALDRTGPDEGDLDHQVVEAAGPQPGQGGHLGPALDLEHPNGVGSADHVVDGLVLVQACQVDLGSLVGGHQVQSVVQGTEHAQAQQVELDQPNRGTVLLVPLQDAAVSHAPPLHRAHLGHRPVADDHATGVDAEVPGGVAQLVGQGSHVGRDPGWNRSTAGGRPAVGHRPVGRQPTLQALGEGVLLTRVVPQCPGRVAHRRAGPVGDDVGHLGGVPTAVAAIHVLDDLLPATALDVEVDVGRPVPLRGEEPLEQQAQAHSVGVGDAQRVADRRVGRRSPSLAEDPLPPAELHDVPHHEEVPGESECGDDVQLPVDLGPCPHDAFGGAPPVAVGGPVGGQPTQEGHLVQPVGARVGRQAGGHQAEVECAPPTQLGRCGHGRRPSGEPSGLLHPGAQVGRPGGRKPSIQFVHRPAGPHRCHGGGQAATGRAVVVDVVGGHHAQAGAHGEAGQGIVALGVQRVPVVPELHHHPLAAEPFHQVVQGPSCRRWTIALEGCRNGALPAPGEDRPVGIRSGQVGEPIQGESGVSLASGQLGL